MRELQGKYKVEHGYAPEQNDGTAIEGESVDRVGYEEGVAVFNFGAVTGTPSAVSVAFKVQTSDDEEFSSGVVDLVVGVPLTAGAQTAALYLDLRKAKKYIRQYVDVTFTTGTTPKIFTGGSVLLAENRHI